MNEHAESKTRPDIELPADLPAYEAEYHLPQLSGTPRQISWARLIRQQLLTEALPQLLDHVAPLSPEVRRETFESMTWLRALESAAPWIELRGCRGRPDRLLDFLSRRLQIQKQHEEEKEQRRKRAVENRALTMAARKFDKLHDLPPLMGTPGQVAFGRRCRYQLLERMGSEGIVQNRAAIDQLVDATIWIDHRLDWEPEPGMEDIYEEFDKAAEVAALPAQRKIS